MANHHKPTREELKSGMDASLEAVDKIEQPVTPPVDPPAPPAEDKPVTPPVEDKKSDDNQEPPVDPPAPPAEDKPVTPPVDWETKFKSSSREAQVLRFKDKAINKAYEDAAALETPTDEEMTKLYPDWENLDDVTKSLAKETILTKNKLALVQSATAKFKEVEGWNEKVDKFVDDPAVLANHPELEGKTEEFKLFAVKETRRGLDFDDLLLAFSGEQAKLKPAPKKGQMFESGTSSTKTPSKPNDGKISLAEGEVIRNTDYKRYKTLLKEGKIRNE